MQACSELLPCPTWHQHGCTDSVRQARGLRPQKAPASKESSTKRSSCTCPPAPLCATPCHAMGGGRSPNPPLSTSASPMPQQLLHLSHLTISPVLTPCPCTMSGALLCAPAEVQGGAQDRAQGAGGCRHVLGTSAFRRHQTLTARHACLRGTA